MSLSYAPASISNDDLDRLKSVESGMGKVLVAVEPATSPVGYAQLSDQELRELQQTEEQLGCIVLAFDDEA